MKRFFGHTRGQIVVIPRWSDCEGVFLAIEDMEHSTASGCAFNRETSVEIALAILAEADPALAAKVEAIPEMIELLRSWLNFCGRADTCVFVGRTKKIIAKLEESEAKHGDNC